MYEVTMPKLSDSMKSGQVLEWKVKEGDEVREGDVLAEIESDKATLELECFHDGIIAKIIHVDGDEVPVGEAIAYIRDKGEEAAAPAAEEEEEAEAEPPPAPPQAEEKPKLPPKPEPAAPRETGRVAISPYARKLAAEKGVDVATLKGSGPGGRIVAKDVEAAAAAKAPKPEPSPAIEPMARAIAEKRKVDLAAVHGTGQGGRITADDVVAAAEAAEAPVAPSPDEELPPIVVTPDEADVEEASFRLKTQARRVTASKHVIPHFYMTRGADVHALLLLKDELKDHFDATVTHFVLLASLKAIEQHPEVNRSYDRGRIIKWKGVNLGLAIDTERGLTVAVLRNAQGLGLKEVAERTKELVEKARAGKLTAEERRHPTFTVTNLGMFDVEHFEPIINPPSSITMGVSSAIPTPVIHDEAIYISSVMRLTLACDHRIIEGVLAARFLRTLKDLLEDPETLLGAG